MGRLLSGKDPDSHQLSGAIEGLRILHLVSSAERRGAQVFARDLVGWGRAAGASQTVALLRPAGALEFGVPTVVLTGGGDGREAWPVRSLRRVIREVSPHVVLAHGGEAFGFAALRVRRGVPVVYRRIGSAPEQLQRGWRRLLMRLLVRRATVVCVADAVAEESARLFGLHDAVVIPNGVDAARLAPHQGRRATRVELGISDSDLAVLSLGALSWEKDPMTAIAVTARVTVDHGQVVHLFAGDGPLRAQVEAVAAHDRRIRVLGSRDDVGDLLAAADVVLMTSAEWGMEGMPATAIEAAMAGRPVVGFDVAGLREVVDDGRTGYLVPPGATAAAAVSVQRLAEERLRAEMGSNAVAQAHDRFEIGVVAPRYLELCSRLAGSHRRGGSA